MKTQQKFRSSKRFTAIFFIVLMLSTLLPQNAYCDWDDKSDELPGMNDGPSTALLVTGGVLIVGLVTTLIIVKKKKKQASEPSLNNFELNASKEIRKTFGQEVMEAGKASRVQIFVQDNNTYNDFAYEHKQPVSVGLRIRF